MSDGRRTAGALGAAGAGAGAEAVSSVASAWCVGPAVAPLLVGVLGAGGAAWAASLKPYSSYLLIVSGALLAYALWALYRPAQACPPEHPDRAGEKRWARRLAVAVAWTAVVVWAAALALNAVFS